MKVLFFLRYNRDQASSRVRGFYVAEELRERNVECDVIFGGGRKIYLKYFSKMFNHDIIYFQKRYSKWDLFLNRITKLARREVLFDLDDAPGGPGLSKDEEERAAKMMEESAGVIVGSHKLYEFARKYNKRVYLIPTAINVKYYAPKLYKKEHSNFITLGWIGNGRDYQRDLQMLIKPLKKLGQKYNNIKFTIVGALGQNKIYQSFSKIKNVRVEIVDAIEWSDPYEVPRTISKFDIGLYPLVNNRYNQYKCGYKALEYMAMEIPVVASPVGENVYIIEHGKDGFLVSHEKDWEEVLDVLIKDKTLRKKLGKLGRQKVEKYYSLDICVNRLMQIFKDKNNML